MSEEMTLSNAINNAVAEWSNNSDKALLTNFVFCAEFIEEDGGRSSAVVSAPGASISSSIGLAHYAENFFSEVQRRDILGLIYVDEDCDDCEDDDG